MGALFAWDNLIDTAALSANHAAGNCPVTNLADPIVQKPWRSLDASSAAFTAIFSTPTVLDFLLIAGCTLSDTDTVQHKLWDASNSLIYNSGAIASGIAEGYGLHFHLLSELTAAAKWECTIDASSREADGFFDVGRAWAGTSWQPTIGVDVGYSAGWDDKADTIRAQMSGVNFTGDGAQFRRLDFTLSNMDSDDRAEAMEMARVAGKRGQRVFVPDTSGDWAKEAIVGRILEMSPVSEPTESYPARYAQTFRLEQDL